MSFRLLNHQPEQRATSLRPDRDATPQTVRLNLFGRGAKRERDGVGTVAAATVAVANPHMQRTVRRLAKVNMEPAQRGRRVQRQTGTIENLWPLRSNKINRKNTADKNCESYTSHGISPFVLVRLMRLGKFAAGSILSQETDQKARRSFGAQRFTYCQTSFTNPISANTNAIRNAIPTE